MNDLINQIRCINTSSLTSVKLSVESLSELKEVINNIGIFKDTIKGELVNREVAVVSGFFFNIFNEEERKELWGYVTNLYFKPGILYELFRTINYKLFIEVLETGTVCTNLVDIFNMEFIQTNINSKEFEEDIVDYCDIVFRKIGVLNTERYANVVATEILNNRIDSTEYEFLKIKLLVILLETSELRNEIDLSTIRNHIDFTLNITMMKLILDDLVIRKYKKEKNGQISHYFNIYFRLERMAKNYD